MAHKVLADRDGSGDQVRSVVDPEARRNKQGQYYDGYLLDISVDADSELITALDVLAANADEAANAQQLVEREEQAQGNEIEELSMDGIGFRGDVLERLGDADGLAVTVYVPPVEQPRKSHSFKPGLFELDESGQILTCPGGKQTSRWHKQKHGRLFYYSVRDCRSCPLARCCLGREVKTAGRRVFKSDYEVQYQAARERAQTER